MTDIKTITEEELLEDLDYYLDALDEPIEIISSDAHRNPAVLIPYAMYVRMINYKEQAQRKFDDE